MPFKSKAQRRKFAQLLVEGKIARDVFEEWNRETGGSHLPERVTKKKASPRRKSSGQKQKRKAKATAKTKRTTRRSARPRSRKRKTTRSRK